MSTVQAWGALFGLAAEGKVEPEKMPTLEPVRAEIPPGFWEQYGLWVILAGVVLLVVAGILTWFLTRPKAPQAVPPEVEARKALETLRREAENGAVLSRVSQVLRRYVGRAFGLAPGELTTGEFCHQIAQHPGIGAELAASLSRFLRACDERKFAPASMAAPMGAVKQALDLLELSEARRAAGQSGGPDGPRSAKNPAGETS